MRVERHGGPPDLQSAAKHFVVTELRGRQLDDHQDDEAKLGKFPDFACFRDLILIEMKHLEVAQNERITNTYKKALLPGEEPFFYGTRRVNLDTLSNGSEIKLAILSKLAQTVETHLRKANRQFGEYRARNPRKNSLSICLLLNSSVDEFSPDVVMHSVHGKMKSSNGEYRFPNIDGVIYVSEKHFQQLPDGRAAFAIVSVIGFPAIEKSWKMSLIEHVTRSWSEFRTGSTPVSGRADQFESVEDIPEKMPRHEAWKLAYRRNPYLAPLTDHQLKLHFHRCVAMNSLGLLRGSWQKPDEKQPGERMRNFDDAINEINRRGIDMREFSPKTLTSEDHEIVYAGLPQELVDLLTKGIPPTGEPTA